MKKEVSGCQTSGEITFSGFHMMKKIVLNHNVNSKDSFTLSVFVEILEMLGHSYFERFCPAA